MKISQVLDTRRSTKWGYPVKIRVSYSSKADLFPTGLYSTKEVFRQVQTGHSAPAAVQLRQQLQQIQDTYTRIIGTLPVYAALQVRAIYEQPKETRSLDAAYWFEQKMRECIEVWDSYGNSESYRCALKFYQKHFDQEILPFSLFTIKALFEIQRKYGVNYSISTIGKYARHLRAVFNLAIAEGVISRDIYPFRKNGYIPPVSRKRKHALSKEAMQALVAYQPCNEREQFHLDLFFFSFYGNGLNLKDVATLRWKDMNKYHIIKKREKTRNRGTQEDIKVYLMPEILAIIERHGTKDRSPNNYIFPLLQKRWDSARIFKELRNLRGIISRTLTGIAKKLGIEGKLPHGTSRHCFANALKQAGAPLELISETIGHSSVAVTKHYTSDFEEAGLTYQAYLLKYTGKK